MDHFKILKRAGENTWRYRALWVFGVLVALTSFRGGGSGGGGGGGDGSGGDNWGFDFTEPEISPEVGSALVALAIGLACLVFVLFIVGIIARYVATTALIRMVDEYEETGRQRSVRAGFRLGWSHATWRLFLMDLLVWGPAMLLFIPLILVALAPLLLLATGNAAAGILGVVGTIGLCFLSILIAIVVFVALALLTRFFRRVCVLEGLGVVESVREGYDMVRRHLKDVGVMWLIMAGVEIGSMMAMFPIFIVVLIAGGLVGGMVALMTGGLTALAAEGAAPWIVAGVFGIPTFMLLVIAPLAFLGGLLETFKSNVWTLTYRELLALEGLEPELEATDME